MNGVAGQIEAVGAVDRPPAGTPCVVCEAGGHFCAADQYVAGDSGKGICTPCVDGTECATYLAQRQDAATALARYDSPVAETQREHPVVSSWSRRRDEVKWAKATELFKAGASISRVMAEVGISGPTAQRIRHSVKAAEENAPVPKTEDAPVPETAAPQKLHFEKILPRLLGLAPGETISFVPPVGIDPKFFQAELTRELARDARTMQARWYLHLDESGLRVIVATTSRLGKVTVAPMPAKRGRPRKTMEGAEAVPTSPGSLSLWQIEERIQQAQADLEFWTRARDMMGDPRMAELLRTI